MCVYVCMYVFMHVCVYVCMYVSMYICKYTIRASKYHPPMRVCMLYNYGYRIAPNFQAIRYTNKIVVTMNIPHQDGNNTYTKSDGYHKHVSKG